MFLVEGEHMKEKLASIGCPRQKILIQRIAIPVDRISYVPRKPKQAGEKVILMFVGRFVEKKGLLYALRALEMVRERNRDFEFRIIGDGALRDEIDGFIVDHDMAGYVKMLGFLGYADYIGQSQEADLFLHPSVTAADGDIEGGAPTVILEAQAMGMPVISTIHADIPNVVVAGESALLSPERDVVKLAANILDLLDNRDQWERMGGIGRAFVEKHHNLKTEVAELEAKYDKLLAGG